MKRIQFVLAAVAVMFTSLAALTGAPMLIPAPREMSVTGGECQVKAQPKVAVVKSIPPEGYELSITARSVPELEWKVWPRGLAFAEVAWANPDPKKRDFAEFSARAAEHRRRLIREHVNCAPLK